MRVLIINVCCTGSTGKICEDIAERLLSEGNDVMIAFGRGNIPERMKPFTYKITTKIESSIDGLKTRILDNAGFNSKSSTIRFIKWIDMYNPDVIHLHNLHGYYINISVLFEYLKKSGVKTIWTLHDCWSFTGHCTHFSKIKCVNWQNNCRKCLQKSEYPRSILLSNSTKNYLRKREVFSNVPRLTVVTPSKWLADLVRQTFLNQYKVVIINNGIDTRVFHKAEKIDIIKKYDALLNRHIVLAVSSVWTKAKGLEDIIWLSRNLPEEYVIVIIGLNKKQMGSLPDNIIKVERTDNQEQLVQWYSAADVFINPTYEDTFPTVNIEAVACSTPVITYDTGGSAESMYRYGKIVKQGDKEKLLKEIITCDKHEFNDIPIQMIERSKRIEEYIDLYRS